MKKYLIIGGLIGALLVAPTIIIAKSNQKKADLDTIAEKLDTLIEEIRFNRQVTINQTESRMFGGVVSNVPTFMSAASSSAIIVGPDNSVQVVATSSKRNYLLLTDEAFNTVTAATSSSSNNDIYCRADQDQQSTVNQGIRLSGTATSSTSSYEFTADRGNLYTGAVRCSAKASTTLGILEYRTP